MVARDRGVKEQPDADDAGEVNRAPSVPVLGRRVRHHEAVGRYGASDVVGRPNSLRSERLQFPYERVVGYDGVHCSSRLAEQRISQTLFSSHIESTCTLFESRVKIWATVRFSS